MIESPNERENLETFRALLITERKVFLKNATDAYESTSSPSSNSTEFQKVNKKSVLTRHTNTDDKLGARSDLVNQ